MDAPDHGGSWAGLDPDGEPSLFAPGPGDLTAWWRVIKRRPDLKPEICRVDDGVDRCGAADNGVIPLAAALAFRTLKGRLLRDILNPAGSGLSNFAAF
jgi:DNA (cytosine-5)-methyltransferase 1